MAAASEYSASVPDLIKQYVVYFYRHIRCAAQQSAQPVPRDGWSACLSPSLLGDGDGCIGELAGLLAALMLCWVLLCYKSGLPYPLGRTGSGTSARSFQCTRSALPR